MGILLSGSLTGDIILSVAGVRSMGLITGLMLLISTGLLHIDVQNKNYFFPKKIEVFLDPIENDTLKN